MPTGRGRFTNVFSIIHNTVNLKTLSKHGGIYILRWSTEHSLEFWKDLSLMLKTKRFQRSCHVHFPSCWPRTWYWYIIWRVSTTNRRLNLKNPPLHIMLQCWACKAKSVFYSSILTSFVVNCTLMIPCRILKLWVKLFKKVHFRRCLLLQKGV